MAPGLRSGRTGHPKVVGSGGEEPGGCLLQRTDAGGEGRCLRTRCRVGAAGMLANCLLSVGMLLLLARCALAAEEKPNYDASGSSSLQSDPAPTAAPVHPLADLSVAEAVPFSVVHSDGEPEGEGLLGQPAFSSVLTVMAGTVKHPVSLDQNRTSPTITRDKTDTTQWPSHSSSQGSEMSSSSLSAGDRILLANSGFTSNVSHQYNTQSQAVTMASTVSRPSHVSFMNGNKDTSFFSSSTVSISPLSSSVSPSAPSTSSVLSSVLSLFSLPSPTGWINKAASLSQSQRSISSPASQTKTAASLPAGSLGWTDNVTTTQSISHSDVDLTAVTWGLQSTTTKASDLLSKTSIENNNKITKQSPADKIHDVGGTYRSASTETGTYTSYSTPNHEQNVLKILYRPTQTQNLGMTSVSTSNLEISTSFPGNRESQAVERQQEGLENPTSALLSARPKGYSVSSHFIQQMLNHTAYAGKENKTFVPQSVGGAVMSLLSSHVVNPTVSPALTFTPAGSFFTASSQTAPGKTSLSVTAITELTRIHSGIVSSEYAPNPGDLLMAEGQDSTRVPAININYNQGKIAEAQLRSISPQAHWNNSLLPSQPRPESTTGSILSLIATTGTTSSRSESGSLHLSSNRVLNIQEFATQTDTPKGITQSLGWLTQNIILPYKNMNESVSHPTWPTYISPLLSHSPNDNTNDHNTALSAKSEIHFAGQAKASSQITPSPTTFQTRSLLTFPHKFHTPPPQKSQQTVAKIPAHITESKAVYSSATEVKTSAGNVKTAVPSTGTTSSLSSNGALNIPEFVTQTGSPKGITQKSIGRSMQNTTSLFSIKTMSLSDSVIPVELAKDITNKMFESISQPTQPTYLLPLLLSHSPNHNNTDHKLALSTNSEVNFADHAKASLSSQITPSQKPFQTRSLLTFPHKSYISDLTPPRNKSHQIVAEISAHITKSKAVHSIPSTFEVKSRAGNGEPSPPSNVLTTHGKWPSESVHRNTEKASVSPLLDENGESSSIRHTAFNKKGVLSGQFTTLFPSFMTTKDFYVLSKGSETSGKGSPTEMLFSPVPFDPALGSLKSLSRKDDATLMGRYEQASSSTWSEIILAQRKTSTSHSQGSVTVMSDNKSNFYLDTQTTIPSISSSDATTSSSDGQNSSETFSSIFSFGSKIMAPYTKWKTTKPSHQVSFQSTASKLEYTSLGFDRTNSDLQADGPSYEHPKLEDEQKRIMDILNSTGSTVVASDPSSLYPVVREHPSFTSTSGSIESGSLNLSPVYHGSTVADNIQPRATVNTPAAPSSQGSDGFLFRSHVTTDTVTSSQGSSVALVYKSKQTPLLSDVGSLEAAFRTVVTHSNNPARSSSETVSNSGDSKPKALGLPAGLMASSSSFPPSPLSSEASSVSYSHIKSSQLSYLHMDPPAPMSSKASSSLLSPSTSHSAGMTFSIKPTMYPGTASSSASINAVPATSPSSSPSLTLSIDSEEVTKTFVVLTEAGTDELIAGTSRAVELTFPKEKAASLAPSQSVRITLSTGPTERTSQVSPLPPQQDTTTASVRLTTTTVASTTTPFPRVTTGTTQSTTTSTPQPTPVTRRTTTTTAIRSQTSRRTFTPPVPRTSPPRGTTTIFISPFTTTTEAPPQQCNITERLWVKTVVSIYVRRNRLDSIQRQNLRRGLSQGLRKALNDSSAQAQVETVFGSPNMTVAYHVTGGDIVYPPSVVLEGLDSYGRDKLIADLRQYLPMVTALPLPVTSWRPIPATGYQLKTVLQFVGEGDDPRSCRFSQMMEQRLEKVFSEAQAKVLNINSRLSVQMLSVSQAVSSPAVSLVYTVKNGTAFLNGTTASNLLGQLSAELVGYFLFYPPLIIAEPMEYHNLNTSIATRDLWVITVIQDVDNTSLEGQYQSFASLMEQRLAELFVLAGQQGTRFRRATAVGSYTVQMVSIRRVSGLKNPAEMTYYVQHNGIPLSGTSAAKVLNTVDSQTMALTLGYFVQLQAEPVVKNPPNNLWIIAAVLAPIAVVTLIIFIITAVLCRKNKNDFKADAIGNLNPRAKMAYRRDVGYYHQPVQGFDYAKQHLGQQGGDEETLPASQDTLVMSLQIRDTPLSLEKALQQDGTANKKSTTEKHKSKLPSEDGSVISNESEKLNSGRGLTVLKVTAQQKLTKEETRKRDDPYDTSSGSLQLISIKPMAAQPNYSHPASSDRSQDSAIVNGEVNLALKQKSDIEHYRNKLRLKAKRKGYYDFPSTDGSSSSRAMVQRQRHGHERAAGEHGRPLEPDDERGSTYVKSHRRHSQVGQTAYRSRQSLSSPSPGGTEMDLLVMRERPRRGIRNSGYDTEPELIEETNVDRLMGTRGYMYGRGLKGHSETSTLSSQPSIDEVRQQMHLLLEEAFSLASGGQSTSGRRSHHHHPPPDHYSHAPPPLPYADVVTSAPGTMSCGRGGLQWVPSYGADVYQCSLPKPAFHFTQLPEMAMGSPPPLPPRTGPPPGTSLRRSTSDLGPKGRSSETSVTEMQSQHDNNPYGPTTRAVLPSITAEQPVSNYSGNPITAVYAIPATRAGYSEYFVSTPPTSYHSPSWMSYPPEPEDVPPQWADSLPLPGYVEAFPHPRYPQGSPTRLPLQYNQALEQPPTAPSTASQQSLPQVVKDMDSMPLSSLSTSALVQAIRQEVAKLAKKQNDVFEF